VPFGSNSVLSLHKSHTSVPSEVLMKLKKGNRNKTKQKCYFVLVSENLKDSLEIFSLYDFNLWIHSCHIVMEYSFLCGLVYVILSQTVIIKSLIFWSILQQWSYWPNFNLWLSFPCIQSFSGIFFFFFFFFLLKLSPTFTSRWIGTTFHLTYHSSV
jgi:hypothetical protein